MTTEGGTVTLTHQEQLGIDFLEHYGVAGMKWGKRRAKADAFEIRSARARVQARNMHYQQDKHKVKAIKDKTERKAAESKLAKEKVANLKNPDRVTANRLTRGEKAVSIILGFGVVGIAATSARSRRIERKQELGKYDPKKK